MVIIGIIVILIIAVPTFIVKLPFGMTEEKPVVPEEETKQESVNIADDSLEVSVERLDSNEIEKIPLEKYVISVVASEMPADFKDEALKAQAVAARTYIINHLQKQDDPDATVTDSTEHQVYKNEAELQAQWGEDFSWKMDKITSAVLETKGEVITYNDEPITPTFFSMSNGYTEDAEAYWGNELPYLKSVESKWEASHPNFKEQVIVSFQDISDKLAIDLEVGEQPALTMSRTASNRVKELTINEQTFTGKEVREKLNLRSNDFAVKQQNDHFIFTTKGYGHGVGMSQYGANGMAKDGKTYTDILNHYYQEVEIDSLQDAAPTLVSK